MPKHTLFLYRLKENNFNMLKYEHKFASFKPFYFASFISNDGLSCLREACKKASQSPKIIFLQGLISKTKSVFPPLGVFCTPLNYITQGEF